MKQLLFLLLFPCLAVAQYTGNAGQKITLGEQTTADGLVFRGVASIDTVTATSKITRANKQDTSAFLLLDTTTNLLWHYKTGSNGWIQAGGSTFDTTTLNLTTRFAAKQNNITLTTTGTSGAATLTGATLNIPQYSGGGGVDSTAIKYVNTYGTQTVNGAKTFTTAPTFSTALLGGSGGTGLTTFGAQHRIPYAASATALTTSSALTFDASLGRLTVNGINTSGSSSSFVVNNSTPLSLFTIQNTGSITVNGTGNIVYNSYAAGQNRYQLYSTGNTNNPLMFYIEGGARGSAYGEFSMNGDFDANAFQGGGFYFDTRDIGTAPLTIFTKNNNANPVRVASFLKNGTVGIGTESPQSGYKLHVVDSVYVGGRVSASGYTTRSDYNLKDEIQILNYGLNEVIQMQPVKYTYKSNGEQQLGFIAQDIGTLIPESVHFDEFMGVDYQSIIPILTKAIQEQQALIKALEQRILILENK